MAASESSHKIYYCRRRFFNKLYSYHKIMEKLPDCALICLGHAAAAANCSVTDVSCACNSEVFMKYATPCITETCTVREALFTQNETAVQCHVHPYTNKILEPITITFFILTFIVVLLRVAARVMLKVKFWYDDYFNVTAFVTVSIYTLIDIALLKQGFGVQIWAVPQENISHILHFFLIGLCLYLVSRTLIRVSILLFYLRVFRTPRAKVVITWTLAFVVLFSLTLLFPIVFQCSPVDYFWLQWDGTHQGHCIDFRAFVWTVTIMSIVLDFWVVLIAYTLVSRLQLPLKKKIMVSSMFTIGLLAIAVSIARLPYINQFTGTKDPTIDWVPITIWSTLENYIGVICACLPSLPALLKPFSALKTPNGTKKSNLSSSFASQGTHAVEHELVPRRYEMTPTYRKAVDMSCEGQSISAGDSSQMYHNFNDSEREML
ncbi:hypothetical protein F4679DRAFT_543272 [Xylaria curta]|nr:hypothetical protein F4679DRAFT_543272 [Xylaria curta]